MTTSPEYADLAAALAKAQAEFTVPKKSHTAVVPTKTGGSYSYHYSTLDELLAATVPALTKHGLSVLQDLTSPDGGTVSVVTVLLHSSGQSWQSGAFVLPSGSTPQTAGAAATYGRRYSLGAALSVAAEEDDDAASVPAEAPRVSPRTDDEYYATGVSEKLSRVKSVTVRKGEKNGKPWALYIVAFDDGREASTFDERIALTAEKARDAHTAVFPTMLPSEKKPGAWELKRLDEDSSPF